MSPTLSPGLYDAATKQLLPLQGVHVEASVVDSTAEVVVVHQYINNTSSVINATYVFPLDEGAAVSSFLARVNDRVIHGLCQVKEEAQKNYDAAVARGDGAYLLKQDTPDVFQTQIGNILPGAVISLCIGYVTELKSEGEAHRFVLPTKVRPRYHGGDAPGGEVPADVAHQDILGYEPPNGLSIGVAAQGWVDFASVTSPSHALSVAYPNPADKRQVQVTLAQGAASLAQDVIILFTPYKSREPSVLIERYLDPVTQQTSTAAMLTWLPDMSQYGRMATELVFLCDRSGSMGGGRMTSAKQALQLFLRSLPVNCMFNIVSFGTGFSSLFPQAAAYSQEALEQASAHVDGMDANMGGTQMAQPLRSILEAALPDNRHRQVFVLTDGAIGNANAVFQFVREYCHAVSANPAAGTQRVFALGIGNGVSRALVEGLSRAGRGTSEFVLENEAADVKVIHQLKHAITPAISHLGVDWGVHDANTAAQPLAVMEIPVVLPVMRPMWCEEKLLHECKRGRAPGGIPASARVSWPISVQAPFHVPQIFPQVRVNVYAIFRDGAVPSRVRVTGQGPSMAVDLTVPVESNLMTEGNLVHRLAARSLIRDLEEGSSWMHAPGTPDSTAVRAEITALALCYGLTSRHTSFLAVETRDGQQQALASSYAAAGSGSDSDEEGHVSYIGRKHKKGKMSESKGSGSGFGGGSGGMLEERKKRSIVQSNSPPTSKAFLARAPVSSSQATELTRNKKDKSDKDGAARRPAAAPRAPQAEKEKMSMRKASRSASSDSGGDDEEAEDAAPAPRASAAASVARKAPPASFAPAGAKSATAASSAPMGRVMASSAPAVSSGGAGETKTQRLIRSQRFIGSFELTQALLDYIESKETLEALTARASAMGISTDALATALALVFLRRLVGASQYELVCDKAAQWLEGETPKHAEVIAEAGKILG